jgi:hypothetical protein
MTIDPERERKARFLETFLKENPDVDPRLVAAILRLPRTPFFPDFSGKDLYGEFRPCGWGGRVSPTPREALLILEGSRIRAGERIGVWCLTDPYFLLLLLELTHRVTIVEEDSVLRTQLRQSIDDLGYAYIPVLSSLEETETQLAPPERIFRIFDSPVPIQGLRPVPPLRSSVQGWVLDHTLTGGPFELG